MKFLTLFAFMFVTVCACFGRYRQSGMLRTVDQWSNLKFLVAQGHSPIECWRQLQLVYGEETMSKPTVRRWFN